jgi:hypothetical protein
MIPVLQQSFTRAVRLSRASRAGATAVAMLMLFVPRADAQSVLTLDGQPRCTTCTLKVTPLAPMGKDADPVLLRFSSILDHDSRGRFFAARVSTPGVIAVFDSSGRQVGSFGRQGRGPGEFSTPTAVFAGAGDTIRVFEPGLRMSVFDPDLKFVRTALLAGRIGESLLSLHGGVVVGSSMQGNGQVWVREEGSRVNINFPTLTDAADPMSAQRRLAPSTDPSRFWVARPNAYQLELRSVRGELIQSITRNVPWFREWTQMPPGAPARAAPHPVVLGVWEQDPRHLWVFIKVASSSWRAGRDGEAAALNDYHNLLDLRVEVLDTVDGVVVFSGRLPGHYSAHSRGVLYRVTENDDGVVTFSPFRVGLERK